MASAAPFAWDEDKRCANLRKHGVDFALAERFDFAAAATVLDNRKNYGEVRYQAFGAIDDRLYVIVFTRRGDTVRIISLRKANTRETRRYAPSQKK